MRSPPWAGLIRRREAEGAPRTDERSRQRDTPLIHARRNLTHIGGSNTRPKAVVGRGRMSGVARWLLAEVRLRLGVSTCEAWGGRVTQDWPRPPRALLWGRSQIRRGLIDVRSSRAADAGHGFGNDGRIARSGGMLACSMMSESPRTSSRRDRPASFKHPSNLVFAGLARRLRSGAVRITWGLSMGRQRRACRGGLPNARTQRGRATGPQMQTRWAVRRPPECPR